MSCNFCRENVSKNCHKFDTTKEILLKEINEIGKDYIENFIKDFLNISDQTLEANYKVKIDLVVRSGNNIVVRSGNFNYNLLNSVMQLVIHLLFVKYLEKNLNSYERDYFFCLKALYFILTCSLDPDF